MDSCLDSHCLGDCGDTRVSPSVPATHELIHTAHFDQRRWWKTYRAYCAKGLFVACLWHADRDVGNLAANECTQSPRPPFHIPCLAPKGPYINHRLALQHCLTPWLYRRVHDIWRPSDCAGWNRHMGSGLLLGTFGNARRVVLCLCVPCNSLACH
jgi:hypothetical protein